MRLGPLCLTQKVVLTEANESLKTSSKIMEDMDTTPREAKTCQMEKAKKLKD